MNRSTVPRPTSREGGVVNPIGAILSTAMMLRSSFGLQTEAATVERAVAEVLAAGLRTADIAKSGAVSTAATGDAICGRIEFR